MHLVKLSSAWMCRYSSATAFSLSVLLWWASYTFNTTVVKHEHSHATVRERADVMTTVINYMYGRLTWPEKKTCQHFLFSTTTVTVATATGVQCAYCRQRWAACCGVCTCHTLPRCSSEPASGWTNSPGRRVPAEKNRFKGQCENILKIKILHQMWLQYCVNTVYRVQTTHCFVFFLKTETLNRFYL